MIEKATPLDIDKITNVLHRRCESNGVTLKWERDAKTAATDGQSIILPTLRQPITKEAMTRLYGFVVHECGHHSRKRVFDILKDAQPPESLRSLFNITEDDGMERQVAAKYRGDCKALGESNAVILKGLTASWKEGIAQAENDPTIPPFTEEDLAPIAAIAVSQLSRAEWDSYSNASRVGFMNAQHPVAKKMINDLVNEGWVTKFQDTKDPDDCWDVAIDLFKRLYPNADEKTLEKLRTLGHEGSTEGEEDGQAMDSVPCEGDGDDELNKGVPTDDEKKKLGGEGKVVSWKDAVLSDHNDWKEKDFDSAAGNVGIDWTDYTKGEVILMPQDLINVVDCRNNNITEPSENSYRSIGAPESFMPNNSDSRSFSNQIRRYLQAQARVKIDTERYHGKLNKRSIVKLAMPPIDGGEWNKKLFYEMIEADALNTCIHVLTDWSGSMNGKKMVYAADASGRLVHVFDRILRVPVQLAAFTNGKSRCDIGLLKKFNDRSMGPIEIATAFSRFYKYSSANNDADAVMWAYNQIRRRKEKRKLLLVLSDGCPAGSWYGGSSGQNLLHVTNFIQKEGKVELYGIGICSSAVETYYKNSKVLKGPEDINQTLFSIIKAGVVRGRKR